MTVFTHLYVHYDAHPVTDGNREYQFLSALIGVWPGTSIYLPELEDVPIEVGTVLIFSGSKAHAGSAYTVGNRRLHVYFFSKNSLSEDIAPMQDFGEHFALLGKISDALNQQQKKEIEVKLLENLIVVDCEDDKYDCFSHKFRL
jgi:hypothetical protein